MVFCRIVLFTRSWKIKSVRILLNLLPILPMRWMNVMRMEVVLRCRMHCVTTGVLLSYARRVIKHSIQSMGVAFMKKQVSSYSNLFHNYTAIKNHYVNFPASNSIQGNYILFPSFFPVLKCIWSGNQYLKFLSFIFVIADTSMLYI